MPPTFFTELYLLFCIKYCRGDFMKTFSGDEICGKESVDYIYEFSPHRLSFLQFEENSEYIFEINENEIEENK